MRPIEEKKRAHRIFPVSQQSQTVGKYTATSNPVRPLMQRERSADFTPA
jgi:hypothetical protein